MNELIRRNNEGSFLGIVRSQKKKKTVSEKSFNYYNIRSKNQPQKKSITDYNHFLKHFFRV